MEWQQIDTAPTDGRAVIVGFAQRVGPWWVGEAYFDADAHRWYARGTDPMDLSDGPINPTHWMPLPPPPGTMTVGKFSPPDNTFSKDPGAD
jgi:hypothetical protein